MCTQRGVFKPPSSRGNDTACFFQVNVFVSSRGKETHIQTFRLMLIALNESVKVSIDCVVKKKEEEKKKKEGKKASHCCSHSLEVIIADI